MIFSFLAGTNEIMRLIISRSLLQNSWPGMLLKINIIFNIMKYQSDILIDYKSSVLPKF